MKTVHLTNFFHQASGGIATYYRALAEAAPRAGHQLVLIVSGERDETVIVNECARIHYVAATPAPFFDRRYRLIWPTSYLSPFGSRLRRLLTAERPDLIEIGDKYSLCWLAGLIRKGLISGIGRPALVGTSHERLDDNVGAFLTNQAWGRRWSQRYLGRIYLPLFDHHLANSVYTAEELQSAMVDDHPRPIEVLPMGAEVAEIVAAPIVAGWREKMTAAGGRDAATRLLLYVGRLSPEKNIGLLVEMMERLGDNHQLLVAGSGPLAEWLRDEAARRAPGKIRLLGQVSDRRELIALYRHCDAFIHPNPREPFGIAPLEAMAAGIPLLAPARGGVLTYANQNNAWLAEPQAAAFAATVEAIFGNPAVRAERVRQAGRTAANYRWPLVAAAHWNRFEEIARQFQRGGWS